MDRPVTSKPRGICRYYNTPRGCFAGDHCKFLHGPNQQFTPYDESKTCRYFIQGHCRRGNQCWFRHEAKSDVAKGGPSEEACNICLEKPTSYGLLADCSHVFCHQCIIQWRDPEGKSSDMKISGVTKKCPLCRVTSRFITPSSYFYPQNDPRKQEVINNYKESMARVTCKYFAQTYACGKPCCPFGYDCFYEHKNSDGTPFVFRHGVRHYMKAFKRQQNPFAFFHAHENSYVQNPIEFLQRIFENPFENLNATLDAIRASLPTILDRWEESLDAAATANETASDDEPWAIEGDDTTSHNHPDDFWPPSESSMSSEFTETEIQQDQSSHVTNNSSRDESPAHVPPTVINQPNHPMSPSLRPRTASPVSSAPPVDFPTIVRSSSYDDLHSSLSTRTASSLSLSVDDVQILDNTLQTRVSRSPSLSSALASMQPSSTPSSSRFSTVVTTRNREPFISSYNSSEDGEGRESSVMHTSDVSTQSEPSELSVECPVTQATTLDEDVSVNVHDQAEESPRAAAVSGGGVSQDVIQVEHDSDPPFVTDGRGRVVWSSTRSARGALPATETREAQSPPQRIRTCPPPKARRMGREVASESSGFVTDGCGRVIWTGPTAPVQPEEAGEKASEVGEDVEAESG